jgi:hypothetical protein
MSKTRNLNYIYFCAASIGAAVFSAPTLAWDPIQDALTTTAKFNMDFRLRYEGVNDESKVFDDAEALTLRSRMMYESGVYKDFAIGLEVDDVTSLLSPEKYDDGVNKETGYLQITDPESTWVDQTWISYAGIPDTKAKLGRQRIVLDNERFIGAVGFRQHDQTFDAITFSNKSLPDTALTYDYMNNVHRIFSDENKKQGDYQMDTHVFNAKYEGFKGLALSAYAYMTDFSDNDKASWVYSNDTYGARLGGKHNFGDNTLKYTAEYATQTEAGDNPVDYSADYYLGEIGYGNSAITGTLGYEVLGADDNATVAKTAASTTKGFQTPLGTLHKFQGWADQFLGGGTGNISTGIKDQYVNLDGLAYGLNWIVAYHQYDAYNDTPTVNSLGNEWDASLEKKWGNYSVSLAYANYNAKDSDNLPARIADKDKIWLTMQAAF